MSRTEDQQMVNCRPNDLLHADCLEINESADIPLSPTACGVALPRTGSDPKIGIIRSGVKSRMLRAGSMGEDLVAFTLPNPPYLGYFL